VWQSDTDQRLNRYLIRTALELAARNISADPVMDIPVRIDADTEGVLGHVPITDTILKKIAGCDAFVPDLTLVAKTAAAKLLPNANVMLEYGYALHARTHSIMIPVMNIAYGAAEELPFDMAHQRFPTLYDLPRTARNADRRAARKSLSGRFEAILRKMIAAAVAAAEHEVATGTQLQEKARRYLSPELHRTIERVLYIHGRAQANFICASAEHEIKPNDRKEDFIPYRPSLFPNAPEVSELPTDDAAALSAFYDSLISLADFVNDWWEREGQLPVNLFNAMLHDAEKSMELALVCIDKFDLERQYPPKYEAHGTISSRIKRSLSSAAQARKHHIARFETKAAESRLSRRSKPLRRR
jgi:hypothetical protein